MTKNVLKRTCKYAILNRSEKSHSFFVRFFKINTILITYAD